MAFRIALLAGPVVMVTGLVLMLNRLGASTGIAAAAFGLVAVAIGIVLGYFADRLPEFLQVRRRRGGPAGQSVSNDVKGFLGDPEFRAEYERLAPYEKLARIVIMRRAALGLTQAELAARMGTTASAISRIESGQHATSAQTLKKLGGAFGGRAVVGFEFGPARHPERELVAL